jgi:uncharacterized repeat protein (TIGR01451 family)
VGNGNDYVLLGNGQDSVTLGGGLVNVMVGTGSDTINVGVGSSTGSGTIIAGNGNHSITVGNGSYTIVSGDVSNATITAGNGNNIIEVGSGTNTITVGGGEDYIEVNDNASSRTYITVAGTGSDFITIGCGSWSITNQATGHTITGSGAYSTTIGDPVNLGLSETASNPTPFVNGFETFTLQVQNSGPDAAPYVQIADLLPTGLTLISAATDAGSGETYNSTTGVWTIPNLQDGATATLTLVAQVETTDTITNTATLTAVGEPNLGLVNQVSATVSPTSTATSHDYYNLFSNTDGNVVLFGAHSGSATIPVNGLGVTGDQQIVALNTSNNATALTVTDGNTSATTQISNISILDLSAQSGSTNSTTSANGNTVTLSANDILNVSNETLANLVAGDSSFNQLASQPGVSASDKIMLIKGDSANTVTFAEGGWSSVGSVTDSQGHSYAGYTHAGTNGSEALALISTDITHIVGHT